MDPYQIPESELVDNNQRPFRPITGIFIGLSFTVILMIVVSLVWAILFGLISGIDILTEDFELELSQRLSYMIPDLVISTAVVYFGGQAIGNRTPGKELKFGCILALITVLIYISLFLIEAGAAPYPMWYTLLIFVLPIVAIPYGSLTVSKS